MKLVDVLSRLRNTGAAVFQTSDAAAWLGLPAAHASKTLARLAAAGHLAALRRGLWAFEDRVDRLALPAHLAAPFPAYLSLQTALHHHGMISQIPSVTYAVSLARTRRFDTPLGSVSLHHVAPGFFFGYEAAGRGGGRMATPEKALLDFLYLRPAKTRLFRALPELELPRTFSTARAERMIRRIPSARRRTLVRRGFEEIVGRTVRTTAGRSHG